MDSVGYVEIDPVVGADPAVAVEARRCAAVGNDAQGAEIADAAADAAAAVAVVVVGAAAADGAGAVGRDAAVAAAVAAVAGAAGDSAAERFAVFGYFVDVVAESVALNAAPFLSDVAGSDGVIFPPKN